MDPILAEALQHPTMAVSAGLKPIEERPSFKWSKGLRHFGAAVMLGAALLSPINTASAQTSQLVEQRVEQVVQAESAKNEVTPDRKPSYSSWSPRQDSYKPGMDYIHKSIKEGKEVAPWRWEYDSNLLLNDAYAEISAGHNVENPSGRLLDICRQVQKVDQQMPGFNSHQHGDVVFETCNADGMAREIRVDSIKKFAVAAPVLGGLLAVKGIASAAQVGSGLYLAGMLSGGSMADRRRDRDSLKGKEAPSAQAGPTPPSLG